MHATETIVVTTVAEAQIVGDSDLPLSLMQDHDLPVDIIVTPRRVINVRKKLAKPTCGVIWSKVTEDMRIEIPILGKMEEQ